MIECLRVAVALSLALVGCRGQGDAAPEAKPDGPAAPASAAVEGVVDLDGAAIDPLAPDDRADALIFVRTDCPISNRYAPELGRIAARFAAAPVDLWLVYVDPDETPAQIREHIADYALPGRAIRDPGQVLARRAEVRVTPEAAVFDAGGERRYVGRIDDWYVDYGKNRAAAGSHELVEAIAAALDGRDPEVRAAKAVGCPLPPLPAPS